jgi:DNA-binding MarR family transcriptional regulator
MNEPGQPVLQEGELERVFQAPARLRIMAALMARGGMDFTELVNLLQLTRGNLSVHMKVLDECGYVEVAKAFVANRPRTTYHITPQGRAAFERYVTVLEGIISSARQGRTQP